jgi:hypothetical protein
MREQFKSKKFQQKTLDLIERANAIIEEYVGQGFVLTLRQLYYQFVARVIIENSVASYKRLGSILNDARLAGLVDWEHIEDRTRSLRTHASWDSPSDIIAGAAYSYREDIWRDQIWRPEVWIEKDALLGVIEGVCREFRVPYFAHRGNNSQSEQYKAGKRYAEMLEAGFQPVVLHLCDHDPNGIDMSRDNTERLALFAGEPIQLRRIALNLDQVQHYSLPPNPAKDTDSRYESYVEQFGTECWELDALDPTVIASLVRNELRMLIDHNLWDAALEQEERNRSLLSKASANWAMVEKSMVEKSLDE